MKRDKIPTHHENKILCKICGGKCCKNMGCEVFPEDFKEITREALIDKIKQGFCFDYWEGNPTSSSKNAGKIAYYMRARNKDAKDKIVDASWGGECIFLTPTGCSLKESERPSGGRALIPNKDRNIECIKVIGYDKYDCAIAWLPYNDLIEDVIYCINDEENIKTGVKLPKIIDCDLIAEMKLSGRHEEAKEMLKVFHEDVKKAGRQAKNDYNSKIRSINRLKGICTNNTCSRKAVEGKSLCEECMARNKRYSNKYYVKVRDRGVCKDCGVKIKIGECRCDKCKKLQKQRINESKYRSKKRSRLKRILKKNENSS